MNFVKVFVLLVFLSQQLVMAQKHGVKSFADGPELSTDLPVPAENPNDFISHYNIKTNVTETCTAIHSVEILSRPVLDADKTGISIPQADEIEIYDYYPKYAIYAVCYQGNWGFVPATAIRLNKEKLSVESMKDSLQPPELLSEWIINPEWKADGNQIKSNLALRLLISKTGAVKDIYIIDSLSEPDQRTINTFRNLKFKPARHAGKPVEVWIDFPFEIDSSPE